MHIRARTPGHFVGGVEMDKDTEYDVCPGLPNEPCGAIKQAKSDLCVTCTAKQRARATKQRLTEQADAQRREWHRFYRERMAEGWTPLDCWRDAQERREARGDPVKPRFETRLSIRTK